MTSIKRTKIVASAAVALLLGTVVTGLFLGIETRRQFSDIASSWAVYVEDPEKKGIWISSLRGYLGYGGIIHTFKNYVIRKDESYRQRMLDQLSQFDAVMTSYLAEPLPEAERRALETINATIAEYRAMLDIAERAAHGNWPAERTDRLVKVDDTEAILALRTLELLWQDSRNRSLERIIMAVRRGEGLIEIGYLSMFLVVTVSGIIAFLIGLLVQDLRRAASRASEELQTRLRLERSEQRLAQTVEESPATIIVTDTKGHIQYVNKRFETVTGWTREEVRGRTPQFLQSGDTPTEEYSRMRERLAAGQSWQGMLRNRRKDGESYWAEVTIMPLRDKDGATHSLVAIGEDITEKRTAREQLARSQKIEAVGLLAGGIAHDFNNILTAILGSAHLAAMDAEPGSDLAAEIEQIDIAARRAKTLVRQLLGFARREPGKAVATDLCAIIREVERLMRAAVPPTIRFEGIESCQPVLVLADPTHLHQILMNLCTNAAEAMGGGAGTITIAARRIGPAPAGLTHRPAGWVELVVADTGSGMSPETRERIFDAFFTTKPLGKGTGLGLSVVQGLVQDMCGRIAVESVPGRGTTFSVTLPAAATPSDVAAPEPDLPARGTETIMVVDDLTEVAATLRRGLMRFGYQVEAFTSPLVALERFERDPNHPSLLVSDVVMPDMNGIEMVRRMRARRPDLPVIFCTGFNPAGVALEGDLHHVLEKPIDPEKLGRAVRALLDLAMPA